MTSTADRAAQLLALPAELRLRIYAHSLAHSCTLARPNRDVPNVRQDTVDVALLRVCKQIYHEARPVFHEMNKFRLSYNHLCHCENRYPCPSLNQHMKRLAVHGFLPRISDVGSLCSFCQASGYGLFVRFNSMRHLQEAEVHFEDIFSFVDNWPSLHSDLLSAWSESEAISSEVGVLRVTGLPYQLSVVLPSLHFAWHVLAGSIHQSIYDGSQLPGGVAIRKALEYLDFEANCFNRTARSLLPFFHDQHDEAQLICHLRLRDGPQPSKRLADFTWAISQVLYDIFADDGGSITIDWASIDDGPEYGQRWTFVEHVIGSEETSQ